MNQALKNWSVNPIDINIPRSKQKMRHSHKFTSNTGHLYPVYWREVLPGSTVKMKVSEITRMQTPIFPIMDSAFIDVMFFFVPNRVLWTHWEEFMGENKSGFWEQKTEYEVPQIVFNSDQTIITNTELDPHDIPYWIKGDSYYPYCVQAGSLADYMGIPIVDANTETPSARGEFEVNALPFRAFYQIYNDWWRDENVMIPMDYDKGDADVTASMGTADIEASAPLVPPPYVAKFHDYFTSALPQPQKHDDILLPLGDNAPVLWTDEDFTIKSTGYSKITNAVDKRIIIGKGTEGKTYPAYVDANGEEADLSSTTMGALYTDLSGATQISINQMRQAFAVQRFYEKLARGGSRYVESLKSLFGVTSPDGRLQRAEYLGGTRRPVNINQVVQTSGTTEVTPQGNVAAYSLTSMNEELFTKSFTEHGILMGVQVIRTEHSYQDGLNKMFLRKNMFDYYFPTFANIGEQSIYNKELYLSGDVVGSKDDETFGYQEAWAEYRYMNNRVSGEFRSKYHNTLDAWHFADNYYGLPTLSLAWMEESEIPMDRNIAVAHRLSDQWMTDMFFEETWTQPMPTYSIPGLIDHY